MEDGWSYATLAIHNPGLPWLEDRLRVFGAEGWELVTALSTIKVIAAIGNQMVFVFKKPGIGHQPPATPGEPAVPY